MCDFKLQLTKNRHFQNVIYLQDIIFTLLDFVDFLSQCMDSVTA